MDESPEDAILDRPLEIYRRFTVLEVEMLRTFSRNVHELRSYSFFEQVPSQMTFASGADRVVTTDMREPPREATRAAAALFRQIYWHRDEASFTKTMKRLKRNVHERDSEHRSVAMRVLDDVLDGQKALLDYGAGIAMFHNGKGERRRLTTELVLSIYLNGVWLHGGNDSARKAAALDNAPPFARFTFYSAIFMLTNLYITGAAIVDRALAEADLLPQAQAA